MSDLTREQCRNLEKWGMLLCGVKFPSAQELIEFAYELAFDRWPTWLWTISVMRHNGSEEPMWCAEIREKIILGDCHVCARSMPYALYALIEKLVETK